MKLLLFITFTIVGLSNGAQLSNTYLPPSSAGSAGGHGGFLQGPSSSPSNQYIPPKTTFNQQGQPVQWSHGGWNSGGAGGQQSSWQGGHSGQGGGFSGGGGGGHRYSGSAQSSIGGYSGSPSYSQQPQKPQVPILKFENENDGNGNYHFDYQTGDGTSHQQQGHINNANTDWAENVVQGQYSYTGDDGKQYTVSYKADGNGFQAVGDHLPTPPPQPREIQEVWNRVLSQQAAAGGGDWQQQGGSSGGRPWQGGSGSPHGGGGSGGSGSWQGAGAGTSWQQQQSYGGGASGSRPHHGGGAPGAPGGGFGGHSGGGHGGNAGAGRRPQKPQNQYLPPNAGGGGSGGYHY